MEQSTYQWLTLHRIKFSSAISALERQFEKPLLPRTWRFCPSQRLNEDGLPTWVSNIWGGLGIFDARDDAERMVSRPGEQLPFLSEAVEQWHALLLPVMHHGAVNWNGKVEEGSAIKPAAGLAGGPLVVITTAGFVSRGPEQMPRISRFARAVQNVIDSFGTLESNIRRDVFNGGFDEREGFTASIWPDDAAMMGAAYQPGTHRTLMDKSRDGSIFDRSSFTRARIIESQGSWDGDPLQLS